MQGNSNNILEFFALDRLIKELFQHARQQANRTFIFIDEIDCLCRKRSHEEDEHSRRLATVGTDM